MTGSEGIGLAAARQLTDASVREAKGLLTRLLGPAADELGLILQDEVHAYRQRNLLRILNATRDRLAAEELEARPVSLRVLLPILDGASLEDDARLSAMWAGLLASTAASPDHGEYCHPSFSRILVELTPREARLLERVDATPGNEWFVFRQQVAAAFEVNEGDINRDFGNLERLGLCRIQQPRRAPSAKGTITVSPFGASFLLAVRGPQPRGFRP